MPWGEGGFEPGDELEIEGLGVGELLEIDDRVQGRISARVRTLGSETDGAWISTLLGAKNPWERFRRRERWPDEAAGAVSSLAHRDVQTEFESQDQPDGVPLLERHAEPMVRAARLLQGSEPDLAILVRVWANLDDEARHRVMKALRRELEP